MREAARRSLARLPWQSAARPFGCWRGTVSLRFPDETGAQHGIRHDPSRTRAGPASVAVRGRHRCVWQAGRGHGRKHGTPDFPDPALCPVAARNGNPVVPGWPRAGRQRGSSRGPSSGMESGNQSSGFAACRATIPIPAPARSARPAYGSWGGGCRSRCRPTAPACSVGQAEVAAIAFRWRTTRS